MSPAPLAIKDSIFDSSLYTFELETIHVDTEYKTTPNEQELQKI